MEEASREMTMEGTEEEKEETEVAEKENEEGGKTEIIKKEGREWTDHHVHIQLYDLESFV